jgi:hypothetical protein
MSSGNYRFSSLAWPVNIARRFAKTLAWRAKATVAGRHDERANSPLHGRMPENFGTFNTTDAAHRVYAALKNLSKSR